MVRTEEMLEGIKEKYPILRKARALFVQRDYERAIEIYAEVLEKMAEEEPDTGLMHSFIYLEYAKALIMSNDKIVINPKLEEDQEFLEDLEIAWEVLEIARTTFQEHGMEKEQLRVHLLLSEISEETNNYASMKTDLEEALKLSQKHEPESRDTAQILFKLALVEDVLGDKPKAKALMEEVVVILQKHSSKDAPEIEELVQEVQDRIAEIDNPEEYKVELKKPHLSVHPDEPVQRISIKKAPKPSEQESTAPPQINK
ncbi:hypothetical protein NECID01_1045 [Nematocida sp. AWRm77]|nr:hypothetical protein NECID01_1045 [Nematocida sp. AWRm77]